MMIRFKKFSLSLSHHFNNLFFHNLILSYLRFANRKYIDE
nr:MAG TPA: hypothetical protein [Caudoviricetes sp.]